MRDLRLTLPELSAIAATRVALGGGLALLLADRLSKEQRRSFGWSLFLVGAATTVPIVLSVLDRVTSRADSNKRPRRCTIRL